jgi:hypothetical protein
VGLVAAIFFFIAIPLLVAGGIALVAAIWRPKQLPKPDPQRERKWSSTEWPPVEVRIKFWVDQFMQDEGMTAPELEKRLDLALVRKRPV